jgi:hypothetical protein
MGETFDINLLSNIQGLDKKSSISKEFVQLKRKSMSDRRKRPGHYQLKGLLIESDRTDRDDGADEEASKGAIDITV